MSKVQLVENETIQSLEEEFATLLAHERESMKGAREIRAQHQKEEEERLEKMRRQMQEKKGKKTEKRGGRKESSYLGVLFCDINVSLHRGHDRGVDHHDGTEQAEGDDL